MTIYTLNQSVFVDDGGTQYEYVESRRPRQGDYYIRLYIDSRFRQCYTLLYMCDDEYESKCMIVRRL